MFNVVFFGSNGKALASKIDVSSLLVGDGLYYQSNQLASKTFSNEFASIVSAQYMFTSSNIKTFSGSLTSLQDGTSMFRSASSFTSFTSEMPNLSNGTYMFYNTPLASFSSALPNLRIGENMFQNAADLPSFSVPLPKLTNGSRMFDNCPSLETFDSVLPSLENGSYMFQGCKLSGRSVRNIVESLPTYETQHSITIGINCTEDIEGQREFLRETGYNTFEEIEDALAAKGWKVVWHFQGFPSGWRPVEYLESTGAQYFDINTSVTLTSDCSFTYKAQNTGGSGWQHAFGTRVSANIKEFGIAYNTDTGTIQIAMGGTFTTISGNLTEPHEIIATASNNSIVCNGITYDTLTSAAESLANINIFKRYGIPYGYFIGRIFKVSMFNNGQQLFDYVPCIDNIGNACMYDHISKVSLYKFGSSDFIVPTISVTFSLRQPKPEFAQITPTGIRKLYHLPYDYEGTLEEFVEENGFKQLVENEKPEEGNWMPEWTETEDAIILNWVEAPEEIAEI